jgi:hypothetical protein
MYEYSINNLLEFMDVKLADNEYCCSDLKTVGDQDIYIIDLTTTDLAQDKARLVYQVMGLQSDF